MKTKNILSIAALIICGMVCVNSVNAEEPKTTGEVTVNIILEQVQSIKVLPAAAYVNLEYGKQEDYEKGVEVKMSEHLEIFSTGSFEVWVDGTVDFAKGDDKIDAGTVTVTPTTVLPGVDPEVQTLGTEAKVILSSDDGISATKFDITYKGAGGDAYINKPVGTYTTNVTYSITAP